MEPPEHFSRFPCMLPHVGKQYRSPSHKRVLVLGESHYQPDDAKEHLDAENWYSSNEGLLTAEQREWIFISKIIQESKAANYRLKSHGIYRETARELNNAGLNLSAYADGIEHCMFLNYFQRPAEKAGKSIRAQKIDIHVATGVLHWLLCEYKPEMVIVVSRLAGRYVGPFLTERGIPFAVTPHPTTPWWNRAARLYGGLKGRQLFSKLLFEQSWLHQTGILGTIS